MQLLKVLVTLFCAELVMSFRSFTRVPKAVLRTPVRMMSDAENAPRTFVDYTLFKARGALSIKPIPATVKTEGNVRTIARDGTLLFEFAPAASASASPANREFDWTKKLSFSLSATELGEIIRMKETDTVSLTHNPSLAAHSRENSVMKRFSLTPAKEGNGVFASLSVNDKNANPQITTLSVMITWGELEVIRSIARYCIPRFIGLDLVV